MRFLICAAAIAFSAPVFAKDVVAPIQSTAAAAWKQPSNGYLPAGALNITTWLPPAPAPDSTKNASDIQTFFATRALTTSERFKIAEADNVSVIDFNAMAARYADALGGTLTEKNAPLLSALMLRVAADAFTTLAPMKKQVDEGGRHRPIRDFPGFKTCEAPHYLLDNGSYPSGHALFGWTWANILAEIAPERADALFKRGMDFGDSRVICGFHYVSDVEAGRLAANQLLTRLHADKAFRKEFAPTCEQAAKALKLTVKSCPR